MTPGNNRKVACRKHEFGTAILLEHRKFRLARQDEKKLVAFAVELPRWSAFEGGDTSRASVRTKALRWGATWLTVQIRKVQLDHFGNRFVIEVVHPHHWPSLQSLVALQETLINCAKRRPTVPQYEYVTQEQFPIRPCMAPSNGVTNEHHDGSHGWHRRARHARVANGAGVEKLPLTYYDGAEGGIRTRDPHLGKVAEYVLEICSRLAKCCSVHPVSTTSSQSVAVVERSTNSCGHWTPLSAQSRRQAVLTKCFGLGDEQCVAANDQRSALYRRLYGQVRQAHDR